MSENNNQLLNNEVPVFKSWNGWYILIILVNVLFILGFFYYFNSL